MLQMGGNRSILKEFRCCCLQVREIEKNQIEGTDGIYLHSDFSGQQMNSLTISTEFQSEKQMASAKCIDLNLLRLKAGK